MMGATAGEPAGAAGRNAGAAVVTAIHVFPDRTRPGGRRTDVVAMLRRALAATKPELAVSVAPAARAISDPLRDGGEGLRDFRLAAALGSTGSKPGDLIAIEAPAGPEATLIKIRPARATSMFAGLMAPPLEGLCALGRPITDRDFPMLRLAFAGHALAAAALRNSAVAMTPASARLIGRLTEDLLRLRQGDLGSEERALLAWGEAWCGLVTGDRTRLVAAHRALQNITADAAIDLTPRETAQAHANLAVVALALGAGAEGERRLGEALDAARVARQRIAPEIEPVTAMDLDGLIGEIALALARIRSDPRLLVEAAAALRSALARAVRAETRERWQAMLDAATSRRKS